LHGEKSGTCNNCKKRDLKLCGLLHPSFLHRSGLIIQYLLRTATADWESNQLSRFLSDTPVGAINAPFVRIESKGLAC
jgi:hypothetical protein